MQRSNVYYLALDNFGGAFGGLAWPETDAPHTDHATLIRHLLCANLQ